MRLRIRLANATSASFHFRQKGDSFDVGDTAWAISRFEKKSLPQIHRFYAVENS